eukprot:Colp12_sorted_trinity150504_noHs@7541
MKAVVLAAGYGTRLERDLKESKSAEFANLVGVPKPLLPVGSKPLITRWVEQLDDFDAVYVVTNARHYELYTEWAKAYPTVKIVSDGTTSNDNRIGAVADLQLAVDHFKIDDDLLIIGGDTLFLDDFSLKNVVERFRANQGSLVLCYLCSDEDSKKVGILELDESKRVTAFLEKPGPEATQSRFASPCFYIVAKDHLKRISSFLHAKASAPLTERDAPGNFIKYLQANAPVYAIQISGRFDVGGLASYKVCHDYFLKRDATAHS